MAKKGTAGYVALAVAAIVGVGIFMFGSEAGAAELDPADDEPDIGQPGGGDRPGKGPGGSPKPVAGGDDVTGGGTYGTSPPGAGYFVPEDWDPYRGLFISPECELVVEAPGWYCGALEGEAFPFQAGTCMAVEAETYAETMLIEGNGVAGFIDYLINLDFQPEEIALRILTEASPLCADLPTDMWPDGLYAWYQSLLVRVIIDWENAWGIAFEPEEEAVA